MIYRKFILFSLMIIFCLSGENSRASTPVLSDSRIKTFIYNENDVYTLLSHYGYQSNIEFAKNERVQTISLGDRVAWQVIPAGRRIFIRPQEENVETNMTVVTNKRSYQFDLRSAGGRLTPNAQLSYVIRFYYPEDDRKISRKPKTILKPNITQTPPAYSLSTQQAAPVPKISTSVNPPSAIASPAPSNINLNYTYVGSENIAPLKIFDNGKATFFKFPAHRNNEIPNISVLSPTGRSIPLQAHPTEKGFWYVPTVADKMQVSYSGSTEIVQIYNERL